eukprot:365218-Chlamydomonas_euryale.AAC.5
MRSTTGMIARPRSKTRRCSLGSCTAAQGGWGWRATSRCACGGEVLEVWKAVEMMLFFERSYRSSGRAG